MKPKLSPRPRLTRACGERIDPAALTALPPEASAGPYVTASAETIAGEDGGLVDMSTMLAEARRRTAGPAEAAVKARVAGRRALTAGLAAAEAKRIKKAKKHAEKARKPRALGAGFARMVAKGAVPQAEAAAAFDLARVLEAAEAGMMAATDLDQLKLGGVKVTGRKGAPQFAAIEGYADRYLPWAREMGEARVGPRGRDGRPRYPGRTAMAITIAVVVDGRSMREAEQEAGVRNGTGEGLLMDALRRYERRMRGAPGLDGKKGA